MLGRVQPACREQVNIDRVHRSCEDRACARSMPVQRSRCCDTCGKNSPCIHDVAGLDRPRPSPTGVKKFRPAVPLSAGLRFVAVMSRRSGSPGGEGTAPPSGPRDRWDKHYADGFVRFSRTIWRIARRSREGSGAAQVLASVRERQPRSITGRRASFETGAGPASCESCFAGNPPPGPGGRRDRSFDARARARAPAGPRTPARRQIPAR